MSDWKFLNGCRIPPGKSQLYGTRPADGFNGAFHFKVNNIDVLVLASDGAGWQHVSVSVPGKGHTPSWQMMSQIKALFWEEEDVVMQLHPPKSMYVNHHPGCLHLWRPTDPGVEIPLPKAIMVETKFEDGRATKDEPNVTEEEREKVRLIEEAIDQETPKPKSDEQYN